MGQVEFSEVEDSIIKDSMDGDLNKTIIEKDVENESKNSSNETSHIYISFQKNISLDEGISLIENQILEGQTLNVSRRDETGNAVVAIIDSSYVNSIKQLSQVSFVKIDSGAQVNSTTDSSKSEVQTIDEAEDNNEANNIEETQSDGEALVEAKTQKISQVQEDEGLTETTEIPDNKVDTEINPFFTPIIVSMLIGLAIIFCVLFIRRNKW